MQPFAHARRKAGIEDIIQSAGARKLILQHIERRFIRARDLHAACERVVHQLEKFVVDVVIRVQANGKIVFRFAFENTVVKIFERVRNHGMFGVGIVEFVYDRPRRARPFRRFIGAVVRANEHVEQLFWISLLFKQELHGVINDVLFVVRGNHDADTVLFFRLGKFLFGQPKEQHINHLQRERNADDDENDVIDLRKNVIKRNVPGHERLLFLIARYARRTARQ